MLMGKEREIGLAHYYDLYPLDRRLSLYRFLQHTGVLMQMIKIGWRLTQNFGTGLAGVTLGSGMLLLLSDSAEESPSDPSSSGFLP